MQLSGNAKSTSMNQSYKEKKRGLPKRSETAPSAVGIDPIFPPLKKLVSRLLALSNKLIFLAVFVSSVLMDDWHLHSANVSPLNKLLQDSITTGQANYKLISSNPLPFHSHNDFTFFHGVYFSFHTLNNSIIQ